VEVSTLFIVKNNLQRVALDNRFMNIFSSSSFDGLGLLAFVGFLGGGISPSQSRYLHRKQTQTQKKILVSRGI
jgi:hypothetical protein